MKEIEKTLLQLYQQRGESHNEQEIRNVAIQYAKSIEAACWSPRSSMTDERYKAIVSTKTVELCRALLGNAPSKSAETFSGTQIEVESVRETTRAPKKEPRVEEKEIKTVANTANNLFSSMFKDAEEIQEENPLVTWDYHRQKLYNDPFPYFYY